MDVVFAFVLLVMAAAIVVLFAMMGELSARLPDAGNQVQDHSVRALEDARIGAVPDSWPTPLLGVIHDGSPALILVLSTACASCEVVAAQLAAEPLAVGLDRTAVVVSCGTKVSGDDFLERHGLRRLPYYLDEDGAWVTGAFGVRTSPSALLISNGRLDTALVFEDIQSLRTAVPRRGEVAA